MSLPIHSSPNTPRPTTLAQAVAQAHHPRNHATAQLESHREDLLRLAQAGESAESLVGGLRLIGIHIGRETMRRWLQQQLGKKTTRRRRSATRCAPKPTPATVSAASVALAPNPTSLVAAAATSPKIPVHSGADDPVVEGTPLIRPGERPSEAFRRRLAALKAHDAAAKTAQGGEPSGSRADDVSMPPS